MLDPTRQRRRSLPAVLALGIALVLAACNGDDPGDDGDAAAPAGDAVTVASFDFSPNPVTVSVGTTVTWANEDSVGHTVTSGAPGEPDGTFDEETAGSGGTATITFDEAGTFAYFCRFHPQMLGEVVVQ